MTRKLIVSMTAMMIALAVNVRGEAQDEKKDDQKKDKIQKTQQEAQTAFQNQDFKEAANKFQELTDLAPKNARAWFLLGYCLHMNGQIDKAIPAHKKAASFKNTPTQNIALYNLGCAYSLKKNKEKALHYLEESLRAGFNQIGQSFSDDADLKFVKNDKKFKELEKILEILPENRVFAKKIKPTCPVMGKPCKEEFVAEHNGGKVFFCCAKCVKAFEKETEKYSAKANYQLVVTKQAKCVKCPFSGNEHNAKMTTKINGVEVGFCNEKCLKTAKEAGEKQIELIFNDKAFKNGFVMIKKDKK